jgi:hypothetical protein
MTMTPGMPFPMPGMPSVGATPQQPAAPVAFNMTIPPDANWEPFESTDTLEMDGFYCCQITKESARTGDKPGVWFTLVIQDQDAKGKVLNRFLSDSRTTQKDTWHQWRGLLMSIYGTLDYARQGLNYQPGIFTGQYVYVKTGAYLDRESGAMRTGIDAWAKKTEWEAAYKANSHRWKPHPKGQAGAGAGGVGMLPGGLPGGFPAQAGGLPGAPMTGGLPTGGGLPGAPTVQTAPAMPATTPQPPAAPMQPMMPTPPAPAYAPPAPPQQMAPTFAPPAPQTPFAAPPGAPPPAAPNPFSFQQPPSAFPPNGAATPQPPPTAAGLASTFPVPGQG